MQIKNLQISKTDKLQIWNLLIHKIAPVQKRLNLLETQA